MTTSYEQQALELIKENEALKAQVNNAVSLLNRQLDNPMPEEYVDQELTGDTLSFIQSTPEQCLNSVKASAVQEFANRYCGDCTTEYQTKLNEDANEWVYSVAVTGEA